MANQTGQQPTQQQIETWRAAYREVATAAIAELLASRPNDQQQPVKRPAA